MRNLLWGLASLVFVVLSFLGLLLAKVDIGDIVYAILSGSIIGSAMSLLALSRGATANRATFLLFNAIVASTGGWLLALLLLKIITVNLYGVTAIAFDLIVGIVGAVCVGAYLFEQYSKNQTQP
jgi:hypothetical protein